MARWMSKNMVSKKGTCTDKTFMTVAMWCLNSHLPCKAKDP